MSLTHFTWEATRVKNLNLNLQPRNCLNQSWIQGRPVTDVMWRQPWFISLSAVHIPFSGVVTGEGYGPKDNSYEEVIKAAREVERWCILFQALSIWCHEDRYPHSTGKETEAQKDKTCFVANVAEPDARSFWCQFHHMPLTLSGRKEASHELGFETCTKATTTGSMWGSQI